MGVSRSHTPVQVDTWVMGKRQDYPLAGSYEYLGKNQGGKRWALTAVRKGKRVMNERKERDAISDC